MKSEFSPRCSRIRAGHAVSPSAAGKRYFDLSSLGVTTGPLCSFSGNGEAIDFLSVCADLVARSPVGRAMLAEAGREGWTIMLGTLETHDYQLDIPARTIIIDDNGLRPASLEKSPYFCHAKVVALTRALRDVWQEKRHGGFETAFGAEAVLMLERVRAADCDVLSILVAWEIRADGEGGVWRHLVGSAEGDIALAFSLCTEREAQSLYNGKALSEAFRQWFTDEARVNSCDHETLEYLDRIVAAKGEEGCSFGSARISAIAIERISCLPDKTAYLMGLGGDILADPFYAGLDDGVNQTHFTQILHDLQATTVHNVPFRDPDLAARIFPYGIFGIPETLPVSS